MFERIIVPVDGSTFGELALPWALGIAGKSGGEIRLVTVITPLPTSTSPENLGTTGEGSLLLAREHAEEYQAELRTRLDDSGVRTPVSTHVEIGSVVPRLEGHARETGADLMVMTTHGRGPLRRAWLGSVADGLLRRTPCPILAVRPGEGTQLHLQPRGLKHLLVTLDGSPESREILPFAKGLGGLFRSRVTLLRVIPHHFPLTSPFTSHTAHGFQGLEAEEAAAREALESEVVAFREEGMEAELEVLTGAHPADGILEFAEGEGVDLVAMATHGRGGVARLVLGSVADKVVRGGNVPVLLHRAQAQASSAGFD
jgi:nucleotide-binding universal stress UspA family protein